MAFFNDIYSGQIEYFFQNVLSRPESALPKGTQWVVFFDGFPDVIGKVAEYEPSFSGSWDLENALQTAKLPVFHDRKGCVFAQAVSLPGDGFSVTTEGTQYGGLVRSTVGSGGRNPFQELRVGFLDTNVSFVENVIRPWAIVTAHLGMIAYKDDDPLNYRTNVYFHKLGSVSRDRPPYIRQTFSFYGLCPISVSSEEYNYISSGAPTTRDVNFTYHYYTVDSSKDILT